LDNTTGCQGEKEGNARVLAQKPKINGNQRKKGFPFIKKRHFVFGEQKKKNNRMEGLGGYWQPRGGGEKAFQYAKQTEIVLHNEEQKIKRKRQSNPDPEKGQR